MTTQPSNPSDELGQYDEVDGVHGAAGGSTADSSSDNEHGHFAVAVFSEFTTTFPVIMYHVVLLHRRVCFHTTIVKKIEWRSS